MADRKVWRYRQGTTAGSRLSSRGTTVPAEGFMVGSGSLTRCGQPRRDGVMRAGLVCCGDPSRVCIRAGEAHACLGGS